tara:strand:+ start:20 stop:694 length:675 start_codon:yes stop_codon:yes gene_type:complete
MANYLEIKKIVLLLLFIPNILGCSVSNKQENIEKIWSMFNSSNEEVKIITSSMIKDIPYKIIEIKTNGAIIQTLMLPISERNGYTNYISGNQQAITMQGNMISKTNGFNSFLISLEDNYAKPLFEQININNWVNYSGKRTYKFLTPTYLENELVFECIFKRKEKEKIYILENELELHMVEQLCSNNKKSFKNSYWLEENGFIWKSRQLISNDNIFAELSILKPN